MTEHAPPTRPVGAVLRAGLVYFACVFGAGFVLGPLRVLFLVPQVGTRTAELLEMPVMLLVIVLAARWLHARQWRALDRPARAWVGLIALGCTLGAEVLVGMRLRGMSLADVFLERDPVSGAAYYGMLALFAAMPWLLAAWRTPPSTTPERQPSAHHREDTARR